MVDSLRQTRNRAANKEQECTRDCLIRWYYGEAATAGLPPERGTMIRDRDLFPVPPPVNNVLYAYGDCLLWWGSLNSGGYAGNRHRQVFEEVSGEKLRHGQQVNHLCQRPFCLQAGHLYAGDEQDNADDRKAHDGSYLRFDMLEGNRVPAGARKVSHWWRNSRPLGYSKRSLQRLTAIITPEQDHSEPDKSSARSASCSWRTRNGRDELHRLTHLSSGNFPMSTP